ncbi:unnamed protein product [Pelagomonas calceolata]|uniref:UBA domain-containing protein n=1 Tax=Pelagomonas calceolata TaxID=35677 RepID=A0A7S4A4N4_9STRA|nr:unnamed protein product [Pelagomonas calceolata]
MGAGASASEQSQLLAEARAGGATQEEIDAYIAENNLNTAQRPAQTQPSHAQLTQMGFSPDAVAMALSLGLESMEDATQWLLDHPDAGGGDETDADVRDEEALLHYAIAESILQKSRDNDLTTDEKRLVPWATEVAELHEARRNGARFDEKRFGELREALKRERNAIDRNAVRGMRADWVTALNEVDDLRRTDASATRLVSKIRELERELLSAAAHKSEVDELRRRARLSGADADEAERKAARCDALLRRSAAAHAEAESRRSEVMAFSEDSGVGKETLERVYLYLKDKVHNKEPLEAADVKAEVFGPHGVDEQAGAELVPKVLQLILLEEDELLLKNLVKGVFVDDPADDVDESDDELALAPVEAVLLAASKPDTRVEAEESKPHIPPESDDESDGRGGWPEPEPEAAARSPRRDDDTATRSTLEQKLRDAKEASTPPGSELDVSMLTFADHDAQLEAIEVCLMERNNAEEAARDRWHDAILAKAQIDLRVIEEDASEAVAKGLDDVRDRFKKKRDKVGADAEKLQRVDKEGHQAIEDAREALERFAECASRGLEEAAARSLKNRIAARARLRAQLEKRFSQRMAAGDINDVEAQLKRQDNALQAHQAASLEESVSAEHLAMVVADVAARDARGRRRRADERASDRVKARRRLLERLSMRTSNAEIEFREWAELCRDDDQNDLRERRLDEAKLCGDVYGELKFLNAPVDPVDITRLTRDHHDQRKQLSDRLARRHAEKRMRCIEKVRTADRDVSDAALEALDEKLCDERRQALDALSDRHVDALRGRLLLARVDANNVLQVLPAAQRIGDGLAKAVTDLQGDDLRKQALKLIERHAAEHERVDDMLADARLKQQEALRRRVRERLMRSKDVATDELDEWSELEKEVDRREVKACAAHHASFCGEAVGICARAGGSADMSAVADLVRDHDECLRALAARLHDDRARRRGDLLRRLAERKGDVEGELVQLDADLEAERRQKMHEFVAARRSKVLECVAQKGTLIVVESKGTVDETKSQDSSDDEQVVSQSERRRSEDYRALFATLQRNEERASESRRERRVDDARRHKESIERRLARRRSQSRQGQRQANGIMSPLTDVVAQIEAARDSSSMARKLDANRRREFVARPAPSMAPGPSLAFSPSTGADAVPARKFGRGMGFSSGPKSPEAKKEQGPKRVPPVLRAGSVRAGAGFSSKAVGVAEAKEESKS